MHHYFKVFKGGAKPEPGMKPYSRFYQYTYVAIYRQLKEEKGTEVDSCLEEISFEPIVPAFTIRPHRRMEKNILELAFIKRDQLYFPPPDI